MKTTGFRLLQLGTPWRNLSYIVIETDEGISGIGEARVLGKTHTVAEYLKDVERHINSNYMNNITNAFIVISDPTYNGHTAKLNKILDNLPHVVRSRNKFHSILTNLPPF